MAGAAAEAAPLFHKTIRINPGQVTGGPLVNFPFLFNTTDPALRTTANGGNVTNVNGWDIIFATSPTCADSTTCGGNKLDHEIESYNATTGQLIAWVRVPSIDNGTVFYVHYSDSAVVASTENRPGVWNSGYKGVWHLKETPPAVATDSTVNANNGTPEVSPTQTAGQIDGSLAFDGTSERDVNVPNSASLQLPTNMTVSGWARTTSIDGQARIIVAKWFTAGSMRNYWLGKLDASTLNFFVDAGQTVAAPLGLVNDGLWHYVVGVADAAAPAQLRLYIDGNQRTTNAYTGTSQTGTSELRIGRNPDALLQDWDGGIDEVRVSNVARPAGWIATEYANQSSPSTFYTLEGMKVLSGYYVGNGLNGRAVTGLGFRPDIVIISAAENGLSGVPPDDNRRTVIRTSTMIGNLSKSLIYNLGDPLVDRIQSLDADGFTVGHPSPEVGEDRYTCVNHTGVTYYWVAFQAADGELKLGTYVGNNVDSRNITGIGLQPDYVIVMPQTVGWSYQRSSAMLGDLSYHFEGVSGPNFIQALLPDGFQVGNDNDVNGLGVTFHYAAWKAIAGKMNVGSYVGNGVDNRNITPTGFRPEYVVVANGSIQKSAAMGSTTDLSLVFRGYANCAFANDIQALQANGFQVGNDGLVNTAGTYYWAAFGPHTETYYRSIGTAANDTAGTVTATTGSVVVTGTLTDWKTANRGRGDRINIAGTDYVIEAVISDNRLILTGPFAGASGSYAYTIARQFTTLQAWEDCVDGPPGTACPFFPVASASLVADGRREVGIAYNDSVFTLAADFVIDGSTTDATHSITLTADPGNRHNGTPGAGVRISGNGLPNEVQVIDDNVTLEWLEIMNVKGGAVLAVVRVIGPAAHNVLLQNLLIHDYLDAANQMTGIRMSGTAGKSVTVRNTMVWDGDELGITGDELSDTLTVENCSIDWMRDAGATGIQTQLSYVSVRNTISTSAGTSFLRNGGSFVGSNNTSSDATAATFFTNAQTGIAASTLFVLPDVAGADLHLKAGSPAIDAGLDLTSSYPGPSFAVDIDGQKRPAGAAWDRGADEFGATTAVTLQSFTASGVDGAVDLSWTTASELSNLGFHLYRSLSPEGPFGRITSSLIPGLGSSPTGASYSYRDNGLSNGQTYYYQLEDVETTGGTQRHGPVSATPIAAGGGGEAGTGNGSGGDTGSPARITYGQPEAASFRVVERGSSYVLLELLTPGFYAVPEDDGTVHLEVPGFESRSVPGAPDVPVKRALVEALAGRGVRLTSVVASDEVRFDGLRVASAEAPELVVTDQGMVKAGLARKAKTPRPGLFPRTRARVLDVIFQGETKKTHLELAPLRYNPGTGRTVLTRRLLVRLDFTGVAKGERTLGGSRGRMPPRIPSLRSRGLVAELVASEAGLQAVKYEEVLSGPRGFLSSSLRLSRRGQSVAFHVEPERAAFGPGSVLYFVSEGSKSNPWGDAVYELEVGKAGTRMPALSGAPTGSPTTEYLDFKEWEENRYYQAGLLDAPDLWLWDLLVSPVTKSYPFTLSQISPSSTSVHLTVRLQGASDFEADPDHHVRVSLNGQVVGEATWDGKVERVIEAEVGPGILQEGSNTLSLENVGDTAAAYSMVFLNRFSLSYPRLLRAEGGLLQGGWNESGTAVVSGLGGGGFALDVQDTLPQWLRGVQATSTDLSFRAEAGRKYLVVSAASVRTPQIRRPVASRLRNPQTGAEWLLVAPREFLGAAQPLVELRRSQGLKVKAVSLEEVEQEFGCAEHGPSALKEFLEYAYQSWPKPLLRYVVLLGDGSYDPKDYLKTGVKDRIPPYIMKTSYLWTASDPAYGAVNGEDLVPDVAVGRLPAGSVEQARVLVDKIVAFEAAGRTLAGRAVLIADNADLGGSFEADADEIATSVLRQREVEKVYLRDLQGGTRATIVAAFDNGPGLVSYIGHGGTAVWASENVFNNTDVATLSPQGQQPLLLTMNCLNGFFHFPPLDSLAEAFLKAEGKGAVAAFSPSGLSVNDAAHLYHKAVLSEIESGRHARLGDAFLAAQSTYADSGVLPELLSIYHLFGDPALRLR